MTDQQYKTRFINKWKKSHSRKTKMGSRLMLAYNVPGTSEHGTLSMWRGQPASTFRPESKNPKKTTKRSVPLKNFTGTVTLQKNGNVLIKPSSR